MSEVAKRWIGDGKEGLHFHCPGCDESHSITYSPSGWTWNGDLVKPTISPSILSRSGHYAAGFKAGDECWCTWEKRHPGDSPDFNCAVCHSFVRDGKIEFLGDCTHKLAGQTIDLQPWAEGKT